MKVSLLTVIISFMGQACFAQIGGKRGFEFINTPADTRMAAMGGANVSLIDWDPNMLFQNPGSLNPEMHGHLSLQHAFYNGGINLSRITYAHQLRPSGIWAWGIQNINYGTLEGYDPIGNPMGEMKANETALIAGHARQAGNFSLGASLKLVYSGITGFNAWAAMVDIGGVFRHPEEDFTVGMNIRNAGFVIADYLEGAKTGIPFDVQLGTSYKPRYMPVRMSMTIYNLYQGNILYDDPDGVFSGEPPGTFSKIFSHLNFGAEVLINEHVHLRGGYNYLIRRELKLEQSPGGAGLSYGLMFRIKAFEFSYSRAVYHVAGGINHIGITSNINSFYKKKI